MCGSLLSQLVLLGEKLCSFSNGRLWLSRLTGLDLTVRGIAVDEPPVLYL
jgi:hypothetical protein